MMVTSQSQLRKHIEVFFTQLYHSPLRLLIYTGSPITKGGKGGVRNVVIVLIQRVSH